MNSDVGKREKLNTACEFGLFLTNTTSDQTTSSLLCDNVNNTVILAIVSARENESLSASISGHN